MTSRYAKRWLMRINLVSYCSKESVAVAPKS